MVVPTHAAMDQPAMTHHAGATSAGNAMFLSELMMCIVIIGVTVYFAVDEYYDRIRAARFVEPMENAGNYRLLWIEEYAERGLPPADSAAYDRAAAKAATRSADAGAESLGSVSGLEALRARAAQGADAGITEPSAAAEAAKPARQAGGDFIAGISDGVPMAIMHKRYFEHPVMVEFRPAMQSSDAPVVRWLCDAGPPPAGWSAPPARSPRPPDELLPSVCRKGRNP